MQIDEKAAGERLASLRVTIEEIAKAKGWTIAETVRRCIAALEESPPTPPNPAAPARHLPIDDSGESGCVAWCPGCRDLRFAREAAAR